jgi:LPS O-antigen subunit length determinant protein (WzzB/FepE family)
LAVVAFLFLGAAAGVVTAYLVPRAYRGEVVVMPLDTRQVPEGVSGLLGGLGGSIASLAGLGGGSEMRQEELELLQSRGFAARFIAEHHLAGQLFPERLDSSGRAWQPGRAPTIDDSILRFHRKVFDVVEDHRTGIVRVSMTLANRLEVANWANMFVADANRAMRARTIDEAQKNLEYLRRELDRTKEVGIQQAISKLSEAQLNQIMLASVREDYAFKVLDQATQPDMDKPVRPNRPLIFLMGCTLGALLAGVYVSLRPRPGTV